MSSEAETAAVIAGRILTRCIFMLRATSNGPMV